MAYIKKTREQKETEVKTLLEDTEKKVNEYFESPESIKEYLSFMAKFYNYSVNNSILIDHQFRGAVGVGSYAFWKEKNFLVNKGEKGIKILVPRVSKDKFKNEKGEIKSIDKATAQGKIKIKDGDLQVQKSKTYFAQGYVFDVSQTNAKAQDLPNIFPNKWLEGTVKNYNTLYKGMEEIAKKIGVKIVELKQELGVAKGVSFPYKKEVALNPRNTELQNVKTLLHELTHAKLHTMDKLDQYETHEKEFQAELTAYSVCSHFGIDTSDYSLKYLHDWTENKTLKDKKQLLKEVRETTVEYIEVLEETLINEREVEPKEQQLDDKEKEIYEKTEVSKLDNTKGIAHIYQFDDKPEKCFIGRKVDNGIKRLGAVETLEGVKKEFKEFKFLEREHTETLSKDKIQNSISKEEDFEYINENYGNMDNFTKESIKGSLIDNYIIKSMSEKILEQDHQPGDQEIYEKTEVSKIDSANTIVHIYQFNNEPEKCFLGCKVNNTVKKLGAFATIEGAKKEFKEFMEFEKVSSKTVTKDKTEIQSKNYKEVEELSL